MAAAWKIDMRLKRAYQSLTPTQVKPDGGGEAGLGGANSGLQLGEACTLTAARLSFELGGAVIVRLTPEPTAFRDGADVAPRVVMKAIRVQVIANEIRH